MPQVEIKPVRERLGLNQDQFGQLLGVHAMTVSRWESGHTQPSPYQMQLIAAFDVAAQKRDDAIATDLKQLLVGAGIVAALIFLLGKSK